MVVLLTLLLVASLAFRFLVFVLSMVVLLALRFLMVEFFLLLARVLFRRVFAVVEIKKTKKSGRRDMHVDEYGP